MMNPPCTVMVEKILPEMRKRVAMSLKEKGWAQSEIARAVGVSQPMVSRYLASDIESISAEIDENMDLAVKEIVKLMEKGGTEPEIISIICDFCFYIREKGLMCSIHPVEGCRVCMNLRSGGKSIERRKLMDDFMKALEILEGRMSTKLIPEVRINMAAALPGARRREEVLAVPGRLVEIKGELKALTEPEFGASRHMSEVLLKAMAFRDHIEAVVNIAFNGDVKRAMESLGMEYMEFDGENIPEGWDSECLLDPGAYGREPCLYVFGKSPVDVAKKVREIEKEVEY